MRPNRRSGLVAVLVLAAGLTAGACGGSGTHRATTASTPAAVPNAAAESGPAAADLTGVDNATAQLDQELSGADQGLDANEGDPTQ
ncbi:MAG: hypothetical protein JWP02_981 [Acidimicrobiales bacterium]|nr:hypothetical protein [Acidimicrobiales bacterium]